MEYVVYGIYYLVYKQKDPTFWLEGPRQGGFQKLWLVGFLCLGGLLGRYHGLQSKSCIEGLPRFPLKGLVGPYLA